MALIHEGFLQKRRRRRSLLLFGGQNFYIPCRTSKFATVATTFAPSLLYKFFFYALIPKESVAHRLQEADRTQPGAVPVRMRRLPLRHLWSARGGRPFRAHGRQLLLHIGWAVFNEQFFFISRIKRNLEASVCRSLWMSNENQVEPLVH